MNIKIILSTFLFLFSFFVLIHGQEVRSKADEKVKSLENKADKLFVQKDFDKAMKLYEVALQIPISAKYSGSLHLKIARLYRALLDYKASLPHYNQAMDLSEDLFTIADICNYLDALRYTGQKMKAIELARKYAYRDIYHTDVRYQNILQALKSENVFLPIGKSEFSVRSVGKANTLNSEFWIGVKEGKFFYASSNSPFHDPYKKFYHKTSYHLLGEADNSQTNSQSNKNRLLDIIPSSLQNGPFSFSEDMSKIVVTQVCYEKVEGLGASQEESNTFQTKLYYSQYNKKRKRWSSFHEAISQNKGYSYSHPYLFNNDHSLLFASNMSGGFGGYDIYVAHWDKNLSMWGKPINLGAHVNTKGDEISPSIFQDMLIFSSNGHFGFGGYDVYSIIIKMSI